MNTTRADLGRVSLELGGPRSTSVEVSVAYRTWGEPRRDAAGRIVNAVLVEHALTADSDVAAWWGLVGPGLPLDTDRWYVVCANVLGGCRGTTGPATPDADGRRLGSRFGRVTVRDQVVVEAQLADRLAVDRFVAVLGGSMGGMRALEWLIMHPDRVGSALLLATCAAASADQIATQTTQIQAITSDPHWHGGDFEDGAPPVLGLGVARRIAHLTYRSAYELDVRFGREPQPGEDPLAAPTSQVGGRFAVTSYLDHHAAKLVGRFDAGSYVVLSDAMSTHDVGRGRGGVAAALAKVAAPVVVAGIDSDRLYPLAQQQELVDLLPGADSLEVVTSPYGHDGFLIETEAVGKLVARTLAAADT